MKTGLLESHLIPEANSSSALLPSSAGPLPTSSSWWMTGEIENKILEKLNQNYITFPMESLKEAVALKCSP